MTQISVPHGSRKESVLNGGLLVVDVHISTVLPTFGGCFVQTDFFPPTQMVQDRSI